MRRRNKRLILLACLGFAFIFSISLFLRSAYVLNMVRLLLESELQKRLTHSITIEQVSGDVLTGLNIKGMAIADADPENLPLISLDEVQIRYRLWNLVQRKLLITQLHFDHPQVNARMKSDGILNLADLILKNDSGSGAKFPVPLLISEINVEDISISNGVIKFNNEGGSLRVAIGGIYSRSRVEGSLLNWKYSGNLEVRDGRFELNGVETQIDEFSTEFELQRDRGALQSLRLVLGNSLLTVDGEANDFGAPSPQIKTEIHVTLDFHDVQKILSSPLEMAGLAKVDVEAGGPLSEIVGRFGINLPSVRLNGLQFENFTAQAEFTPNSIRLTTVDALFASGKLAGTAEINFHPKQEDSQRPVYKGWVQLDSLRAEELLAVVDFPRDFLEVQGNLDGKLQFSGSGLDFRKMHLAGNLQLGDASLNGVAIRLSKADYQLKEQHLSVTANLDAAQIEINGNPGFVDSHDIYLRITQIDIGKLAQILQLPDLAGEGIVTGTSRVVAGDIPLYSLRGFLSVPEATLYDVPIGVLTTDFHYTEDKVFLNSIRLVKGESELIADGVARLEADTPVDLKVRARPLQIADYVRLAGTDYPIEGVATGELVLDGPLARLNGRGLLRITKGKAWDLALDPLTLPIEIENYVVKIPDFEILTRGQRGVLNAQIDPNQNYVVDFQSESMQLAEIATARGMTDFLLDADLIITARGAANAADPLVDVTFDFSNVTYAGHALEDVYITGVYRNNALSFEGIGFNDTCQIRGVLEAIAGSPYHVVIDGVGIDLLPFLRIFNLADHFAGTADGNIEIEGLLEDLSKFKFQMSLSTVDLDVNGRPVTNLGPIRVSLADNLGHIQSLVLADKQNGSSFLNAMGTFPIQSEMKIAADEGLETAHAFGFTVESNGFPFEGLSHLLGLPPLFSGNMSYKLTGGGTYADPQLELNWNIPDLAIQTPVGQIPIREAVGGLSYEDGSLHVESFNLLLLGNPIEVQGNVQVDFESFGSSELNVHASCPSFKLDSRDFQNLPDYLTNYLVVFNLETQVTGALSQPELSASLNVTQGTIQLLDQSRPIESLTAALQLSAGQGASPDLIVADLKSADWRFDDGHYHASGVWRLPKTGPVLPLTSIVDVLKQNNPVQFHLHIRGSGVNLTTPLSYMMKRDLHSIESQANIAVELQGNGYRPEHISATLICDSLHIKINNHDLHNISDIRFHFEDRQLTLTPTQIGAQDSAWLSGEGALDLDGNIDFHFGLDRLPYGALIPAITLTLLDRSVFEFNGFLTSQIHVHGNLINPIISAEWESDGHIGNANLKDSGKATYQEKLLSLQNTQRIIGISKQLEMSGTIPINLAFQPMDLADRFLNLPIDLKLRGRQISLVPLALLFHPLIEHADGLADIDLSIQGTTSVPYPQGTLSVQNGTLKLADLDTPILHGMVELQADKGEIRIPKLSFQVGQGKYSAEVNCRLSGLVATDFEISRFTANNVSIADFIGNQSRFLNPTGSMFANPEAVGMDIMSTEVLEAYLTAEARVKVPINQFLIPGETAWIPMLIKPFNLPNVIKYVTGQLKIEAISIDGLGYKIRNSRPIEIQLVNQKLSLDNGFSLEDQQSEVDETKRLRVTGFGSWDLGSKLLFRVEMKNLDLGFISGFLPKAYAVRGALNAALDIRGTDSEPEVAFTWETPELSINQAVVDQFTGSIIYEDRRLRISGKQSDDAHLYIGKNRGTLSALIPFHLSFLEFKAEPLVDNIQGGLDIAIGDLDFLSLIFPQFAFTEGMGNINATVGGRLDSLALKGSADLTGLAFDLPESYIRLENGTAHLDLTEEGANIEYITGDMNGGTFQISGLIQSDWFDVQHIDMVAELSEGTTFKRPGFYEFECQSANLQMTGAVATDTNLELPPLRGVVRVKAGLYEQDWKQLVQEAVDKTADVQFEVWFDYPVVRNVQLDLDIIAPNNLWIESNLGDIKIEAAANGDFVGPVQKPVFNGRIELLKGELSHFGHQFEVREGSYIENKNALEFNPWYEIGVETTEPIRNVQLETIDGQIRTKDVGVIVSLSGHLNEQHNPHFQAEVLRKGAGEDYQPSQQEIFSILTFGGPDPLESETSAPTRALEQYLGNQLASSPLAKAAGLSETRLDFSPDNFEDSRFLLTKTLSERLSLTYSSTFQLHTEPRIEVEYQIRRHFYIKGERNERGKYGLDLKLERRF